MKTYIYGALITLCCTLSSLYGQKDILGKWETVDDVTGEAKSIVEIYESDQKIYGKIHQVLNEDEKDKTCEKCTGLDYGKPIEGLVIIKNLVQKGDSYENGTITDPENGKTYRCKIWIDEDHPDVLNVRGYIVFVYRTQEWKRVKS